VRIFVTRWMARFARKSGIGDALLIEAIEQAERGLIDADLGGGVIKQRVGRPGRGRSGGYRTIIAIQKGNRAFFVFAFAKNEIDNISPDRLSKLKEFANDWFSTDEAGIEAAIRGGELEEIDDDQS